VLGVLTGGRGLDHGMDALIRVIWRWDEDISRSKATILGQTKSHTP